MVNNYGIFGSPSSMSLVMFLIGISVTPVDTILSFVISVPIYLIHSIFSLLQN